MIPYYDMMDDVYPSMGHVSPIIGENNTEAQVLDYLATFNETVSKFRREVRLSLKHKPGDDALKDVDLNSTVDELRDLMDEILTILEK